MVLPQHSSSSHCALPLQNDWLNTEVQQIVRNSKTNFIFGWLIALCEPVDWRNFPAKKLARLLKQCRETKWKSREFDVYMNCSLYTKQVLLVCKFLFVCTFQQDTQMSLMHFSSNNRTLHDVDLQKIISLKTWGKIDFSSRGPNFTSSRWVKSTLKNWKNHETVLIVRCRPWLRLEALRFTQNVPFPSIFPLVCNKPLTQRQPHT